MLSAQDWRRISIMSTIYCSIIEHIKVELVVAQEIIGNNGFGIMTAHKNVTEIRDLGWLIIQVMKLGHNDTIVCIHIETLFIALL